MTPADADRCADDMAARWAAGGRPRAEDYLDRFPHLWQQPDAALELVAQELALRDEYGAPATASELAARFPAWAEQVTALLDCQAAFGPAADAPDWPRPGDRLGGFELLDELGRGAHGRVYLASQISLAARPVVLKVAPQSGREHLSLARLQHTHIVPLYSAHEFPDRRLRGLCLPDFGGATLDTLQARLARVATRPATGLDLLAALRADRPGRAESPPPGGPAWAALAGAPLADAACRFGACLADALQYAHDRGLLHLDVKPGNVLVASDGVPMLLDFHLARPPLAAGDPAPDWLGGTPGYMPPEQAAAVKAVPDGAPLRVGVDGRADVFALGATLADFLREAGSEPSPGLAAVLARCTAPAADDRYPTAAALAADLRRHLSDLPLAGVRNRSLWERWGKWRRRRPFALPLALVVGGLMSAGVAAAAHAGRATQRAAAALRAGEELAADGRFAEAAEALRGGEELAAGVPFRRQLRADLRAARAAAERARAADDLHAVCEGVRWAAAGDDLAPGRAAALERECRTVWDARDELSAKLAGQPAPDRETRWQADLLDAAVLAADLGVRAARGDEPAARARALATLDAAEGRFGPGVALDLERARHLRAAGRVTEAEAAERRAGDRPRRGAWDHVAAGRSFLAGGDFDRAAAEFARAAAADQRAAWPHYYLGVCRLRLGRAAEAVGAFSACAALAPRAAWCAYNRGLAYAAAGVPDAARADFDRALDLDPSLAAALVGRAAVHHGSGRPADALADLDRAAALGACAADVGYRAAVVRLAAGDRAGAVESLRTCLTRRPDHPAARELFTRLTAE